MIAAEGTPMFDATTSDFLRNIPAPLIGLLAGLARERTYSAGAVLFAEGTLHDDFHLVVDGHVRLDMAVTQRGRIPLLTVGPGDILAWSALLAQGRMTATATALEPVRTAAFDGEALRALCAQNTELGYHLMKQLAAALSRRLLATRLQLLDLFAGHVPTLETAPSVGSPVDTEC
jgi:CRP/FNR family cyclic AMP-dependent transcriptional regulator